MQITAFVIATMGLLAAVTAKKFGADYCKLPCKDGQEHLLCKFKHVTGSKGECTNIRGRMTPDERMHILDFHNTWRDEHAMRVDAVSYNMVPGTLCKAFNRPEPASWAQGYMVALNMRQLVWSYDNEKAAQIYAEQCTGDNDRYNCMLDFVEEFDQWMSMYTQDGTVDGEEAMKNAFDYWLSTNKSIAGSNNSSLETNKYYTNKFDDFQFNHTTEYLPWASIAYWRTFFLGCGKSHFQIGGKDKTRIVCVYGPGINYIETLRNRRTPPGAVSVLPVLYEFPDKTKFRYQCAEGRDVEAAIAYDIVYPSMDPDEFRNWHPFSFPASNYLLCKCRYDVIIFLDSTPEDDCPYFTDKEYKYHWLCLDDCSAETYQPQPIPDLIDYIEGAASDLPVTAFPLAIVFVRIL